MAAANLTIVLDDAFADALADKILARLEAGAPGVLEKAGMTPGSTAPPPDDDPWGEPAPPAEPAPPPQQHTITVTTPKGQQKWTLNDPSAPACECDEPAALIQGSTNGKSWKRYGCAKGASQDTWRGKCTFSQWA